ncbi:sensor histidine kinase [Emticicia agri]|uniref:histidine kinase n=1 Tax=Emticicia agri TaxID=2492393 RepID=A0A4Q5M3Y5_9BACT|nr:sensor histidine kinase [Emticicia agri]RYU96809.1 sensor histidine kinase [Emticicia agri]
MSDLQLIFIGSSGLIVLITFSILFVVYYKQKQAEQKVAIQELKAEMQRQLLESSLEVQEVERRRIAKDLHDEVGAMLSMTKMSFNQLIKKLNTSAELTEQGKTTKEFLEESISQVRRISRELVPSTLEDFGLISAIDEFIQKIHIASGVLFIFNHEGIEDTQRFDKKIELTIYRIAQELVNNALKHAEAQEITLKLSAQARKLLFIFTDNGKGFDLEAVKKDPKSGLGLRNIESRLSVVNGTFTFKTSIGQGTHTKIEIPLPKNES